MKKFAEENAFAEQSAERTWTLAAIASPTGKRYDKNSKKPISVFHQIISLQGDNCWIRDTTKYNKICKQVKKFFLY